MTMSLDAVLSAFEKDVAKIENVTGDSSPPRYWHSTGNYVLNYILSGNLMYSIPQGRVTALAGPSSCGKSFIQCNIAANAQKDDDTFVLMIDTENALDDDFVGKIGVNTESNYLYKSAITIRSVSELLSSFFKHYRKVNSADLANGKKVLIVLDSLDMLMTDSEFENFRKGENKGDQGQRAKQYKALLRYLVQEIKDLNIAIVITHQVYAATQDQILKGEGVWVVNGAVRYSLSQIALLTRLKLKDDSGDIAGIRMKAEGFKTRFTKPFQTVTIEVPYETGIDKFSGLVDMCESIGVVERAGSWKKIVGTDIKFYAKDVADYAEELLARAQAALQTAVVRVGKDEEAYVDPSSQSTVQLLTE